MTWLGESDLVIAECTQTSLGVGYELGIAEKLNKPVLVLYRGTEDSKRLSAMLSGNPLFTTRYYTQESEAMSHIDEFINKHK